MLCKNEMKKLVYNCKIICTIPCHRCNTKLCSSPREADPRADLHDEDLDERGVGTRQASRRQVPLPPGNTGHTFSAYNTIYYSCLYGSSILIKRVPYKRTLLHNKIRL